MQDQILEQMLVPLQGIEQEDRTYQTLDVYTSGLTQMYTGPGRRPLDPFFPTSTGFGVSVRGVPGVDDYHETFKQDRYDNLYGGHSSITIGGKKKSIFHDD
jgi:hypothetical protein